MPLSGREKATIFLSILGAETSSRVLRYLPDELADLIAAGINHLPTPSPEALSEVMGEFKSFLALPGETNASPRLEERAAGRSTQPRKSYAFLMYERPQIVAFLISILPEEMKEEVLQNFTRDRSVIEELVLGIKKNPLFSKIEAEVKRQYAGRVFE